MGGMDYRKPRWDGWTIDNVPRPLIWNNNWFEGEIIDFIGVIG